MAASLQPETIDEAFGVSALAAPLDGDFDRAARVLAAARCGYRAAFLWRLGGRNRGSRLHPPPVRETGR